MENNQDKTKKKKMADTIGAILAVLTVAGLFTWALTSILTPHISNALGELPEYVTLKEVADEGTRNEVKFFTIHGIGNDSLAFRLLQMLKCDQLKTPRSTHNGNTAVIHFSQGECLYIYRDKGGNNMAAVANRHLKGSYTPPNIDEETAQFFKTHFAVYSEKVGIFKMPDGCDPYIFDDNDPLYNKWVDIRFGKIVDGYNSIIKSDKWDESVARDKHWEFYYAYWRSNVRK